MTGAGEGSGGAGVADGGTGGSPARGFGDELEAVVGLEVHVQLRTATKMFCGCRVDYGAPPNTRVCPVCLGLPGALPVPNENAVRLAVRAAHALGCDVAGRSRFDRKNYFYPDLPKGYQITQYRRPLARDGRLTVPLADGEERTVGIRRLHLEEDAGKSLHDRFGGSTAVDLNRAGVPLAEIVTEPDLRGPAEARAFLVRLRQVLEHYASVSDCNMEEGSLRVDANLSVRRRGGETGARAEVKNLNSFGNVERALAHERDRQARWRREGREVEPETRAWDAAAGRTRELRGKEEAYDYRYFPEPDLPDLVLGADEIGAVREALPEMPGVLERRLRREYGLTRYDAELLAAYPARAAYFEAVVGGRGGEFPKQTANLVMGKLAEELNARGEGRTEYDLLAPDVLARVVELRLDGTLSSTTADEAVERLVEAAGRDPDRVVEEHGLAQVSDADRLAEWVEAAVRGNPEEARRYAGGEERLLGFFMGAVMREADGKADPEKARRVLEARLGEVPVDGPDDAGG
ncbi:MAG: Asp-tRNA(Asn)/Glu-tRNA(Gln) amidotransferase subunit GatB [Gemmatimonadota bacterium]